MTRATSSYLNRPRDQVGRAMSDLSKKRPATLAKMLERAELHLSHAWEPVWAAALNGNERCLDILARLGPTSSEVLGLRVAQDAVDEIRMEARRRYGPAVPHESMWVSFLATVRP